MRRPFPPFILILIGVSLLVLAGLLTLSPEVSPANAQCGTSASSCKNCHEVNAKHPVNTSGAWHTSHAFGDFCSFCHAGNVQATDEKEAHQGMIYPLSDPKGSCASCHADDYQKKAEVYATTLGAKINPDGGKPANDSGGGTSSGGTDDKANAANIESKPIDPPGEKNASGPLIDYNRRYEIEVLGHADTSRTGNTILAGIAAVLTLIGAGLVWRFEHLGDVWRKARAVPDDDWRKLAYSGAYNVSGPVIQPRSAPVVPTPLSAPAVDLPKGVEKLDKDTQAALRKLLADPDNGGAIIRALSRLDPALINNLQSLSKQDRALLVAIVEQLGESKS